MIVARCVEYGECLLWQGHIGNGVPQVFIGNTYRMVRRVVWEAAHGPIPVGRVAVCKCRERACVRLEHVQLMTTAQVARLAAREGKFSTPQRRARIALGQRRRSRLTPEIIAQVRAAENGAAIARELGICKSTVSKIRRGESWGVVAGVSVFGPQA